MGPGFADGFVGREATQGLQAAGEVVGRHEVGEMPAEFVVALVVEALDGRLLDSSVHALDLAIRPRMPRLGQPMFDVEFCTGELEGMAQKRLVPRHHLPDVLWRPATAGGLCEMRAVVGEHRVDLVGDGCGEGAEKVTGDAPRGLLVQLREGELRGPVDGDEEVELALLSPDLGDVDVKVANRVALELRALRLVALGVWQA